MGERERRGIRTWILNSHDRTSCCRTEKTYNIYRVLPVVMAACSPLCADSMGTENENLLGEIIKCACVLPDSSSPGDNPMNSQNMFQHDSEDKYYILNRRRRGKQDVVVAMTKSSSLKKWIKKPLQLFPSEEKKNKTN